MNEEESDSITTSNSQYDIGVYDLFWAEWEARSWLSLSASLREQKEALMSIGKVPFQSVYCIFQSRLLQKDGRVFLGSLEVETSMYGGASPVLLQRILGLW